MSEMKAHVATGCQNNQSLRTRIQVDQLYESATGKNSTIRKLTFKNQTWRQNNSKGDKRKSQIQNLNILINGISGALKPSDWV